MRKKVKRNEKKENQRKESTCNFVTLLPERCISPSAVDGRWHFCARFRCNCLFKDVKRDNSKLIFCDDSFSTRASTLVSVITNAFVTAIFDTHCEGICQINS